MESLVTQEVQVLPWFPELAAAADQTNSRHLREGNRRIDTAFYGAGMEEADSDSDVLPEDSYPSLRLPEDSYPSLRSRGLQSPLAPRYHPRPSPDHPSPPPKQPEAPKNIRCYSTLKHHTRRRKACLAKALNSGRRPPTDRSDQGLHGECMSEDESDVLSELEGDSASTTSTDATGASSFGEQDITFAARRLGVVAAGQHELLQSQKQTRATQRETPSRIRKSRARPLHSFQQQLAKILAQRKGSWSSDTSVLDESDSGAESACSSSLTWSRTTSSPSNSSDGSRSMLKGSPTQKTALAACCQDLDDLTDRLRLRHEEALRRFSSMSPLESDTNEGHGLAACCQDLDDLTDRLHLRHEEALRRFSSRSPLESDTNEGHGLKVKARRDKLGSQCSSSSHSASQGARSPAQSSSSDWHSGRSASSTKTRRSRQLPVCDLPSAELPRFPTTDRFASKGSPAMDPDH